MTYAVTFPTPRGETKTVPAHDLMTATRIATEKENALRKHGCADQVWKVRINEAS